LAHGCLNNAQRCQGRDDQTCWGTVGGLPDGRLLFYALRLCCKKAWWMCGVSPFRQSAAAALPAGERKSANSWWVWIESSERSSCPQTHSSFGHTCQWYTSCIRCYDGCIRVHVECILACIRTRLQCGRDLVQTAMDRYVRRRLSCFSEARWSDLRRHIELNMITHRLRSMLRFVIAQHLRSTFTLKLPSRAYQWL